MLSVQLAFTIIAVLWGCVFVTLGYKSRKAKGDDRRRYARLIALSVMGFCATVACQAVCNYLQTGVSPVFLIVTLSLLALALVFGVFGLRSLRSDKYFRKLYELDRGFCGRCGYNLTGNTSGVCPECGWKLPDRKNE